MVKVLLIWCILSSRVVSKHGDSFVDSFKTFHTDLWKKSDWLQCYGYCVRANPGNVELVEHKHAPFPFGFIQMSFRNDCYSLIDCCNDGECTPYTSGQIFSTNYYGYGSFRWRAIATHDKSEHTEADDYVPAISCFTLENHQDESKTFIIAICISSQEPTVARLQIQIGNIMENEALQLDFDASKDMVVYRMDFTAKFIRFVINGNIMRELNWRDNSVAEVKIGMAIYQSGFEISPEPIQSFAKQEHRSKLDIAMRVYRVRFIKEDLSSPGFGFHDELFTIGESNRSYLLMSIIGILMICFGIFAWRKYEASSIVDGDYFLMTDSK